MTTWQSDEPETPVKLGPLDWGRALLRGVPLAVLVFGGFSLLLVARLPEKLTNGPRRPLTPHISTFVCRNALRVLGIRYSVSGTPMKENGAMVANHSSWLDIFSLNAASQVYFVSKAEVAKWPGIGWLARATGTVFIARDPKQAATQKTVFEERLHMGHRLVFFPEGTSTDGLRVLQFKSTLFAAFFDKKLPEDLQIQPVSVTYHAPDGTEARFYGWWGDMDFAPHLLKTLAARRHGRVNVAYHTPLPVREFADRKMLAKQAEEMVRAGVTTAERP